jgi:hypothetical protein
MQKAELDVKASQDAIKACLLAPSVPASANNRIEVRALHGTCK